MTGHDYDDALATAATAIRSAIAETSRETGLRAGPASEALVEAILEQVRNSGVRWAFSRLADRAGERK